MNEATYKIESHVAVLIKHRPMTKEEGEHFVRHLKGVLTGVGELIESTVKQLTR